VSIRETETARSSAASNAALRNMPTHTPPDAYLQEQSWLGASHHSLTSVL
jgi:hypothetical protein